MFILCGHLDLILILFSWFVTLVYRYLIDRHKIKLFLHYLFLFSESSTFLMVCFLMQAYVLKYLLFFSDELGNPEVSDPFYALGQRRFYQSSFAARDDFSSLTDDRKMRWFLLLLLDNTGVSIIFWLFVHSSSY